MPHVVAERHGRGRIVLVERVNAGDGVALIEDDTEEHRLRRVGERREIGNRVPYGVFPERETGGQYVERASVSAGASPPAMRTRIAQRSPGGWCRT